jgi:hypothetical protein
MAEAKAKKPPVNRFGPSTAEEVTAGLASMSFGVSSATEIGRRALAAKASKAKTPKEAPTLAEISARLSQAEAELQASTANVAPRKSAGRPKKAAILPRIEDEPLLTRVLYHEAQEVKSAAKHGGTGAVPAPKGRKTVENRPFSLRLAGCGISLKEFAAMTGTPYRTVKDWSRGATPTPGLVEAMATALELFPDLRAVLEARL